MSLRSSPSRLSLYGFRKKQVIKFKFQHVADLIDVIVTEKFLNLFQWLRNSIVALLIASVKPAAILSLSQPTQPKIPYY